MTPAVAAPARVEPVVTYDFESNVTDTSGHGNDGTWTGTATYAPGKHGQAMVMDKGTQFVTLPSGIKPGATGFAVGFWLNETAVSSDGAIFGNQDWRSGGGYGGFLLYNNAGTSTMAALIGGDSHRLTALGELKNTWVYVTAVVDSSTKTLSVYRDGVLAGTTSYTTALSMDNGLPFRIGADGNQIAFQGLYPNSWASGLVDDFSFYDQPIGTEQVIADYGTAADLTGAPVMVSASAGGTASASHVLASAGSTVTLTASPAAGYRFDHWQVNSPAGLSVAADGTFIMPDGPVDVRAEFTYVPVSPLASYDFENNVTDTSGHGNDGIWTGAPAYSPGQNGQAMVFTKGTQFVTLPSALKPGGAGFSAEFWLKETDHSRDGAIFGNIDWNSGFGNNGVLLYNVYPTSIMGALVGGNSTRLTALGDLNTMGWIHVAMVVDTTAKTQKIYKNGVLAGSITYTSTHPIDSGLPFRIGTDGKAVTFVGDAPDSWASGLVDDFKFYNQPISADQAEADFLGAVNLGNATLAYQVGHGPTDDAALQTAIGKAAGIPDATISVDTSAVDYATVGDYAVPVTGTLGGHTLRPAVVTVHVVPIPSVTVTGPAAKFFVGAELTQEAVLDGLGAKLSVPGSLSVDLTGIDTSKPGGHDVTVTGTDQWGFTATVTGQVNIQPAPGSATLTPGTPTVSGAPVVGQTLTVDPGTWNPDGVTFTVDWYRGKYRVGSGLTYRVTSADLGQPLTVQVTGSLPGYKSATQTATTEPVTTSAP